MAGLAAAFNGLRTIMDRRSILDGVARGSGATRATAFVAPRQIKPQGLGLLSGSIDEGVDCPAAHGPQPRFIARFQPTGDLLGRPSSASRTASSRSRPRVCASRVEPGLRLFKKPPLGDRPLRLSKADVSGLLLCAVLTALAHAKMPHRLRKAPALGHQHASKRDELAFPRIIEVAYKGLAASTILWRFAVLSARRSAVRSQAVHRRQAVALLLLQATRRALAPS